MFKAFSRYFDFSGRANRNEFWLYVLFLLIVNAILQALIRIFGSNGETITFIPAVAALLFTLFTLIPSLSVSFRRLHDTGRTAWWLLLSLIPLIGALVLIWFYAQPGEEGENKYGAPQEAG